MAARAFTLVAALLLLGGCGGDDGKDAATTATTATTTATTTTGTTTTAPDLAGASTNPAVHKSATGNVKLLNTVSVERHAGFDRVVFEYLNGIPGYDVRYVTPPARADGSGDPVAVSGSHVLVVRMEPALDADLEQPGAPPTYTGPTRINPPTTAIVEVVRIGGFESVLTWAAGVDGKRPFRVTHHESPPRVIVDVSNS